MITKPRVNIILAAYNGEAFIENQIRSILNQDYENIKLCIRDDGSIDDTVKIIKRLSDLDSRICLVQSEKNLGVPNSFYEILRLCSDADYYAFADQDDLWEVDKISRAVDCLSKEDSDKPVMYCSSFGYYEEDGSFIREFELPEKVDLYNSIYYTPALGFTMVFNERLRELALAGTEKYDRSEFGELHDRRFVRTAALFGKVICDRKMTSKHIRHASAVTKADAENTGLLKGWFKNELIGNDVLIQRNGIRNFLDDYNDYLDQEQKQVLSFFARDGKRIKKVFYPKRLRQRMSGEVLLRILFLFGKA